MQALSVPTYRNYLLGAFISEIGNQMQLVGVSWQIYELTRNPAALGLIGVANLLPILLFSLPGGVVADKLDRRKLLIVAYFLQAVNVLILFGLTWFGGVNQWWIYLILVFLSITQSFTLPARQSILPTLVPRKFFMNAVSLQTLQMQTAILIGPAIAGFLIGGFGVAPIYLLNALSFLMYVVIIFVSKIPETDHGEKVELSLSSISEGVKFVISTPILYSTMILDFLATFFGEAEILMPVFAKDVLHVGPQGLGLLYSAPAIGGVFAGLLISSMRKMENQGRTILVSVVLYGLATIGFGLSKFLPLSLAFLVLVGFGDMISTIIRNTVRQLVTPDHLRGRMASVMRMFFQGGPQLGEIEAGFLAKLIGGPATVVVGGLGVVAITSVIAWKNKGLRNFQTKDALIEV